MDISSGVTKKKGNTMKLESMQGNVERSGVLVETSFSIENSPQAFNILANSLYAHKEQSVIRELSTNAVD